jgi:hypothetical protein
MSGKVHNLLTLYRTGSHSSDWGKKTLYIILSVVIFSLIIDSMINFVADFIFQRIATFWGVALFVLFAGIYGAGQFFILDFVKQRTKDIRARSSSLNITQSINSGSVFTNCDPSILGLADIVNAAVLYSELNICLSD